MVNLTVITVGQAMLLLAPPTEFTLFALASVLVSLAAVPVALSRAPAPSGVGHVRPRLRRLVGISPVGSAGCALQGLVSGAFWGLAPVFATRYELGVAGVAAFMSFAVLGWALRQWPLGRLSDSVDRRKVMVLSCSGGAITGLLLAAAPAAHPLPALAIGAAWGFFSFPLYALCVAHANDFAAPGEHVEVSAGLLLLFSAGAVAGPLIAGAVMTAASPAALFVLTGAYHVAFAGFVARRMRAREAVPPEAQVPLEAALGAAGTVSSVFDEALEPESARIGEGGDADAPVS